MFTSLQKSYVVLLLKQLKVPLALYCQALMIEKIHSHVCESSDHGSMWNSLPPYIVSDKSVNTLTNKTEQILVQSRTGIIIGI